MLVTIVLVFRLCRILHVVCRLGLFLSRAWQIRSVVAGVRKKRGVDATALLFLKEDEEWVTIDLAS
jgi:hypothetical protein